MRDQNSEIHSLNANGKPDAADRLPDLLDRIERLPQNAARELATDCIRSVLQFHRDGLARALKLIENAGANGREILDALGRDKLVSGLLLVHDLHPSSTEDRLRSALGRSRPYMESHGGDVELIGIFDGVARLRFHGSCKSCPSSTVTMELAIRRAVEEACPELAGVELEPAEIPENAPARECEIPTGTRDTAAPVIAAPEAGAFA